MEAKTLSSGKRFAKGTGVSEQDARINTVMSYLGGTEREFLRKYIDQKNALVSLLLKKRKNQRHQLAALHRALIVTKYDLSVARGNVKKLSKKVPKKG